MALRKRIVIRYVRATVALGHPQLTEQVGNVVRCHRRPAIATNDQLVCWTLLFLERGFDQLFRQTRVFSMRTKVPPEVGGDIVRRLTSKALRVAAVLRFHRAAHTARLRERVVVCPPWGIDTGQLSQQPQDLFWNFFSAVPVMELLRTHNS